MVLLRHIEMKLTCFISYGHDGLTHVTRHLHKLLSDRGHTVWFDEVSLAHGCDWQKEMEAGILNALTAGETGRFIVMLAKHGFRRDQETSDAQGFCHRESALAYEQMPQRCLALHLEDMQLPDCLAAANASLLDLRHLFTNRSDQLAVQASKRGGGLTDEQWRYLLNHEPHVKRIMHSIVAAVETGCLNGALFPAELWKQAAPQGGPTALEKSASNPTQGEPCRIFVACDCYAVEFGSRIAARLRQAGYTVAFDPEMAALPTDCGAALSKQKNAYVDEAIAWAAGKRATFGQYKSVTANSAVPAAPESTPSKPGKMVLLLTPEAVERRKGDARFGQCLLHFDRAFSMGLRFVPVMLKSRTSPPLAIVGLQWVPFWSAVAQPVLECTELQVDTATLDKCLDALVGGLRDGLASEGQHTIRLTRLQRHLRPLVNTSDFAKFQQDAYVCSAAMDAQVDAWYARCMQRAQTHAQGANVLLVHGPSGCGKTAFAVSVEHKFRQLMAAMHFASAGDVPSLSVQRAAANLMYQVAAGNDAVADSLIKDSFLENTFPLMSSQMRLNRLVCDMLGGSRGEPRLVLVDSADLVVPVDVRSDQQGAVSMCAQLIEAARGAPSSVCIVLTVSELLPQFNAQLMALSTGCSSAVHVLDLNEAQIVQQRNDNMREYLVEQLSEMLLTEAPLSFSDGSALPEQPPAPPGSLSDVPAAPSELHLQGQETADPSSGQALQLTAEQQQLIQEAATAIIEQSQGSLEYCHMLLAELKSGGTLRLDDPANFPPGINALQAIKLQTKYPVAEFRQHRGPQLLGIVFAAKEPLGAADMAAMLSVPEPVIDAMVQRLGSLLQLHEAQVKERSPGTLQWLCESASRVPAESRFDVDVLAGHLHIAEWARSAVLSAPAGASADAGHKDSKTFGTNYAFRYLRHHVSQLQQHLTPEDRQRLLHPCELLLQQPAFTMEERCLSIQEEGMSAFFHAFPGVHPTQLRQAAEHVLFQEPNGSFLLRNTSDGALAVSIVALNPQAQRLVVEHKKVFPLTLPVDSDGQRSALQQFAQAQAFCQLWRQGDALGAQGNTMAQQQVHTQAQGQYAALLQRIPQGTALEHIPHVLLQQLQQDAAAAGREWQTCVGVAPLEELAHTASHAAQGSLEGLLFADLVALVVHFVRKGQLMQPVKPQQQPVAQQPAQANPASGYTTPGAAAAMARTVG